MDEKAFTLDRLVSVSSSDPERPRTDLGFCVMPSRDVRLLCLTLQLFATRGWEVANWLGVTRQRVNQWSTGREPMPVFRRKQLLEIMTRRVDHMREVVFDERFGIIPASKEGGVFLDEDAARGVFEIMDRALLEEGLHLEGKDAT